MNIKFSVIVPVYGVEAYIRQCIDSVLNQSYDNFELILVDDESPDNCPLICDEYTNMDFRVCVVHKKNGGLSDARNTGIKHATGDYILFLDGDDYWLNANLLETLCERINQYPSDVICLNYKKIYENGKGSTYFCLGGNMPEENMGEASIRFVIQNDVWIASAWNKVIRRSLFLSGDLTFVRGITSEDIDWCARLAVLATSFDYIQEPYIGYRQRKTSISKSMTYDKVRCLYSNICIAEEIAEEANLEKKKLIMPFISYQYGTLVKNIAFLQSSTQRREICKEIECFLHSSLRYSNSSKIKILRLLVRLFGTKGAISAFRFLVCLK